MSYGHITSKDAEAIELAMNVRMSDADTKP